jgi:enoyl-CoA hydratase/carnithine racemase
MAKVVNERGRSALMEEFIVTMDRFRALCMRMRQSPLLFVAALNGHTLAGGLELAAACDLRFAADDNEMLIGVPEMDLFGAMPSGGGGAQFLARILEPSRALELVLDAKPITPQRAAEIGLVHRLYSSATLLQESEAFAAAVGRKAGRVGVSAAKRAILGGAELPLYEALEFDRSLHWDSIRRGNFLAGVDAFVERFSSPHRSE